MSDWTRSRQAPLLTQHRKPNLCHDAGVGPGVWAVASAKIRRVICPVTVLRIT